MNEDIMTVIDCNNQKKECIVLAIIEWKENKYIIYKDIDNKSYDNNLYASRLVTQDGDYKLENLTVDEWSYIEKEYSNVLNSLIDNT